MNIEITTVTNLELFFVGELIFSSDAYWKNDEANKTTKKLFIIIYQPQKAKQNLPKLPQKNILKLPKVPKIGKEYPPTTNVHIIP